MENSLTVVNPNVAIQEGGLGVNFENKLFKLKPANLTIVQNNSNIEGAIKGNLRIAETGDQYSELYCTLLVMPTEQRQYHIGNREDLNRTPENLMCFSTNMVTPHDRARIPQAMNCASCPRQDWGPWREYKEKNNGQANKSLIPACDSHYRMLVIDDKYKLPLQMFIRSKAKPPFEQGMQNLARVIAMLKAQGRNPNIFDVRFKITTKVITTGKFSSYVPFFSNFEPIADSERAAFGAVYTQYISQRSDNQVQNTVDAEDINEAQGEVNHSVTEGEYVGEDKEITI
jgi:hypothetical protein